MIQNALQLPTLDNWTLAYYASLYGLEEFDVLIIASSMHSNSTVFLWYIHKTPCPSTTYTNDNYCRRHHKKYSGYILHLPQPLQNAVVESTSIVGTMDAMNFKNTTR